MEEAVQQLKRIADALEANNEICKEIISTSKQNLENNVKWTTYNMTRDEIHTEMLAIRNREFIRQLVADTLDESKAKVNNEGTTQRQP